MSFQTSSAQISAVKWVSRGERDYKVSTVPGCGCDIWPTPYPSSRCVTRDVCRCSHVGGIMGCCTEVAEGWWRTAAVALFSLDAGLSELIRAAVQWGSILLRRPKVLTQTFQVWVMMPQTCHSCHTTDTTFFGNGAGWRWGMGGRTGGGGVRAEMTQDAETALSRICLILHRCMQRKSWINFQSGKERHFPLKLLAIEGIWVQFFNLRIKARPCHYDLWNTGMLGNDAEAVNRCLEAICERWLINGG